MKLDGFSIEVTPVAGAVPAFRAEVDAAQWIDACRQAVEQGGRLVAFWGSDARHEGRNAGGGFVAHAALAGREALVVLSLPLPGTSYPDIAPIFPAADRMQRAAFDLLGISAAGAEDHRKWLRHGAWKENEFPLRKDFDTSHQPPATPLKRTITPLSASKAKECMK